MAQETIAATTDERSMRRARRQALIDAGVNPYPIASEVTAHAAELEEKYAELEDGTDTEDVVSVAGRIRAFASRARPPSSCSRTSPAPSSSSAATTCSATRAGRFSPTSTSATSWAPPHDHAHAPRPALGVSDEPHGALQVPAAPPREVPRPHRPRGPLSPALRRPHHEPEVRDVFRKRSQIISLIRRYMEGEGYMRSRRR